MGDECEDLTGSEINEPCTNKDAVSVVNIAMAALEKGKKITKLEKKLKAETMAGKKKNLFLVLSLLLNLFFVLKFYIL
jgi:hypothetical protein